MLETIGYDAALAASFAPWDAADAEVGRVARLDRGVLTVLTEHGPHRVTIGGPLLDRVARDASAMPCPGDWVVVRRWPDHRETIEHVLPRRAAVRLPDRVDPQRAQVLAANVDLVAVVAWATRPATASRERLRALLDLAAESGATPLVVLCEDAHPDAAGRAAALARVVAGIRADVEVVRLAPDGGAGLVRLLGLVDGRRTLALLGVAVGVTSALARSLAGTEVIGGRRARRGLTVLPRGGALLDVGVPPAVHGAARLRP